jgi:hypothetical protein
VYLCLRGILNSFSKQRTEVEALEKRIFSDPVIPATFEATHKPFKITPQKNVTSGQIEFAVEGENIDEALSELYSNASVGVLDFIKALKGYRSSIFALKSGGTK